eukprot:757727-Amphidinium_carterae.2
MDGLRGRGRLLNLQAHMLKVMTSLTLTFRLAASEVRGQSQRGGRGMPWDYRCIQRLHVMWVSWLTFAKSWVFSSHSLPSSCLVSSSICSPTDAVRNMSLMDAIYKSAGLPVRHCLVKQDVKWPRHTHTHTATAFADVCCMVCCPQSGA